MALFGNKKKIKEEKEPAAKVGPTTAKKDKPAAGVPQEAPVSMQELYSPTAKVVKGAGAKTVSRGRHENSYRVLIKPLVTEKASNLGAENKYVFVVNKRANKISVAKAVQATFGLKPLKVNIIRADGKFVTRGRIRGQRKDWKKAIVTLAKGETIKIYEGV